MRFLFLGASLLLSFSIIAQLDLSLHLQQGYTHNIFRNPVTFEPADGEPVANNQLIQSGTFSALDLALDWQRKWEKSSLKLSTDVGGELFPTLEVANLLRADVKGAFEHRVSKKVRLYQKVGWRVRQRQGDDGGENIFTLPNAYRQLDFLVGARWKPNKENLFRLEGGWLQKTYQPTETSALAYSGAQFRLYHRSKLEQQKTLRYITTTLRFQHRNYLRERFSFIEDVEEEEDNFTENRMRYFILDTDLDFALTEHWTISPAIELTGRLSDEERLAYWQVEPRLSGTFEKGNWKLSNRISFAYRQYPYLTPEEDDEYTLRYFYASMAGRVSFNWKSHWSWIGSWSFTQRLSNFNDPERRAFRPYQYWRLGIGLQYRF